VRQEWLYGRKVQVAEMPVIELFFFHSGEARAARMAAWQEAQLAEMPVIERRVLETSGMPVIICLFCVRSLLILVRTSDLPTLIGLFCSLIGLFLVLC
jgi:hypothetical protein